MSCIMPLAVDMDSERIPQPCHTRERPRYQMHSPVATRLLSVAIFCKVTLKLVALALWCMLKLDEKEKDRMGDETCSRYMHACARVLTCTPTNHCAMNVVVLPLANSG